MERSSERFTIANVSDDERDIISADQFLLEVEMFGIITGEDCDVFRVAVHQLTNNFGTDGTRSTRDQYVRTIDSHTSTPTALADAFGAALSVKNVPFTKKMPEIQPSD